MTSEPTPASEGVIPVHMLSYYPLGAQVMTMVLPMAFFILTLIAMYFVFTQPHTVPGRQPIGRARPVTPAAEVAAPTAAATGQAANSSSDETASDEAPDSGKPEDTE